ncbi:MAG TPA: hypothetical protein VN256_13015 [Pyrinomonadaceae bacterium]|nr:hypothetical protein [Pyrinomonadaceae bacterium]
MAWTIKITRQQITDNAMVVRSILGKDVETISYSVTETEPAPRTLDAETGKYRMARVVSGKSTQEWIEHGTELCHSREEYNAIHGTKDLELTLDYLGSLTAIKEVE